MYPRNMDSVVRAMMMARVVLKIIEVKSGEGLVVKLKMNPGASVTII